MKSIKNYFLSIAHRPVRWGIGEGFLIFSLQVIWASSYWPSEKGINLFYQALIGLPFYCFIFVLINLLVVKMKITVFRSSWREVILAYDLENKPFIYWKQFWGKCSCKIIKLPEDWELPLDTKEFYSLKINLCVNVDDKTFNIPFLMNFRFSKQLNAQDLDNLIKRQDDGSLEDTYFLSQCLETIFFYHNMTGGKETKIKKLVSDWDKANNGRRVYILNDLEKMISFPDLFSGAETQIKLLTLGVRQQHYLPKNKE